jgi:hypothetical protein
MLRRCCGKRSAGGRASRHGLEPSIPSRFSRRCYAVLEQHFLARFPCNFGPRGRDEPTSGNSARDSRAYGSCVTRKWRWPGGCTSVPARRTRQHAISRPRAAPSDPPGKRPRHGTPGQPNGNRRRSLISRTVYFPMFECTASSTNALPSSARISRRCTSRCAAPTTRRT